MKKCFFRLDVTASLGFGHMMRCLAVAYELVNDFDVFFVVKGIESERELEKHNFEIIKISEKVNEEDFLLSLSSKNPDGIWIIDTKKQFHEKFLPSLKENCDVLLLIENLSKNMGFADGILFPAAHLDFDILDFWLPKEKRDKILTGWDWILLRSEILDASISNSKTPIAITTGGSDPSGVFFKIWELLEGTNIHATFLIGNSFINRDKLPDANNFLNIIDYDIEHIASAEIVISTFGISVAECLFLKKPVISIGHSHENAIGSEILSQRTPACINLGYFENITREVLVNEIKKLQQPNKEITSWLSQGIIDGQGVNRVVSWIKDRATGC